MQHRYCPPSCQLAVLERWVPGTHGLCLALAAGDSRKAVVADEEAEHRSTRGGTKALLNTTGSTNSDSKKKKRKKAAGRQPANAGQEPQGTPNGNGTVAPGSPDGSSNHEPSGEQQPPPAQDAGPDAGMNGDYVESFKFHTGQHQGGGVLALPLEPVTLAFKDVNYFVDAPAQSGQLFQVTPACLL